MFCKLPQPKAIAGVLLLLFFNIGSNSAYAHPHIWADVRSQVLLSNEGLVTGVRVEWTTDKDYALQALEGMDSNGNGMYEPDELERLTAENIDALSEYGYFVFFRLNGEIQQIGKAFDGAQSYNPNDGRLTLHFSVPLEKPLDPHQGEIKLKIYDPEFFIDFEYVESKPASVAGNLPSGCSAKLLPIPSDPGLEQTKQELAAKGKDWKPENDEDFGGMFAQAFDIGCT